MMFAATFLVYGQTRSQQRPEIGRNEQEVRKLERDWLDAYESYDDKSMDRIVADDFIITHVDGSQQTKAEIMASLKKGIGSARSPSTFSTDDVKARVYHDTVILIGRVVERFKGDGSLVSQARYTDTYVKRGGRWQVVASQLTALPKRTN
jgi:ketosteroid isomerase-like protein